MHAPEETITCDVQKTDQIIVYLKILKHNLVTRRHSVTLDCNRFFFIPIKLALFLGTLLTHLLRL
jgi:hypothetical protein